MTDKDYLEKMRAYLRELAHLHPLDHFYASERDNILTAIHLLNIDWNHNRRWRHWHFWLKLFVLFCMLALVVWYIVN